MPNANAIDTMRRFEIPGRVTLLEGNGELPKVEVTSDAGCAEIYLHGAHVTDFQLKDQPSVLFTSQCSRFSRNHPIRGGIPIILPWFGAREGEPAHGFARLVDWQLNEATALPEGGATLRFGLPETNAGAMWTSFTANYVVTLTDKLSLELIVTNNSSIPFSFENCLYTYFHVQDIAQVAIKGLKGTNYVREVMLDVYLDTTSTIDIQDRALGRILRIEKAGSKSTVVWNPWFTKAQQMPDFGDDEYQQMVCVESGNVGRNKIVLPPGCSSLLRVTLSSVPL